MTLQTFINIHPERSTEPKDQDLQDTPQAGWSRAGAGSDDQRCCEPSGAGEDAARVAFDGGGRRYVTRRSASRLLDQWSFCVPMTYAKHCQLNSSIFRRA
jgi:hypothetical protein